MQAIPLESVDRLEVFPVNRLEHTDDTPVVQYRGGILPLYDTSGHPGCPFDADQWTSGTVSVVVHQTPHGLKGLVVARIVDTVIESVEETGGMTIIRGSVTQIVVPETWLAGVPQ
jgi:two-component system chemotaxis sensor kinase CheA